MINHSRIVKREFRIHLKPKTHANKSSIRRDWDSRFHVSKMPEYDAMKDIHCSPYFALKRISQKLKILQNYDNKNSEYQNDNQMRRKTTCNTSENSSLLTRRCTESYYK